MIRNPPNLLRDSISQPKIQSNQDLDVSDPEFLPLTKPNLADGWLELLGDSEGMQRTKALIERIANGDSTVLVTGETGTGKELVARAIHRLSRRGKGPFVCLNCSAIPDSLVESELFGYEKGAFTGAASSQPGKLQLADGGTIFLDEVGDMAPFAQAKILRAIESREIQRLGGKGTMRVNMRVIAATHQDLERLVSENGFRSDLFFRLNVVPVRLPPLRERKEDIPCLAARFIDQLNTRYGRSIEGVSRDGMRWLMRSEWPGNVRQLRNVIEGAYMVSGSTHITAADLQCLHWTTADIPPVSACVQSATMPHLPAAAEPDRLLSALSATEWNKTKAAQLLQWSRMTVYRKIAKYNLRREDLDEPALAQTDEIAAGVL